MRCTICGRPLNVDGDPLSADCGGDCWGCIGEFEARMEGNISEMAESERISSEIVRREIEAGLRNANGSAKRPKRD